jgi:hypothetical protein
MVIKACKDQITPYIKPNTILTQTVLSAGTHNFTSFTTLLIILLAVHFYTYCNILRSIDLFVAAESGRGKAGRVVWLRILSRSAAIIAICSEVGVSKNSPWRE